MAKQSANNKPYAGVFQNIEFPQYEYQHYPLMLIKGEGKAPQEQLIVESQAEEEAALKDGWKLKAKVGAPVTVTEKEILDRDAKIAALEAELAAAKKPAAATVK